MTKRYPTPSRSASPSRDVARPAVVVCLPCARARREGRPWGCSVHVAQEVLP